MRPVSRTEVSVLKWIGRRERPSYASAERRWGSWCLDRLSDDGFLAVHYAGIWKDSVSLTDDGKAAIAPKAKRRAADQKGGE